MLQLRRACTAAREALDTRQSVEIAVELPGVSLPVALHRHQLEAMAAPLLHDGVEALVRVVRSAGLRPDELAAVLPVGGAAAMGSVRSALAERLGPIPILDASPTHAVAAGAALAARAAAGRPAAAAGRPLPLPHRRCTSSRPPPWPPPHRDPHRTLRRRPPSHRPPPAAATIAAAPR
ncbi:MAG: Hsp70 family protein [Acidimicrobiales bacterium]